MIQSVLYFTVWVSVIFIETIRCQGLIGMKPCPMIHSNFTNSVDELLGDWHITLLVMDKSVEKYEESPLCIKGRIVKVNRTELIQIWKFKLPELLLRDETEIDFPTKIIQPGVWLVQSPLGGEFRGTILDTDGSSYVLIMYCAWTADLSAHMMTLLLSRSNVVQPRQRLQYLSVLIKNGFDPFEDRIICWSDC